MRQICKRFLAVFLTVCILASLFPTALAADLVKENGLSITASGGKKTITVNAKPGGGDASQQGGAASNGTLTLTGVPATIGRDYEQAVTVTVENTSGQAVQYYLECENPYDDIYMNFVSSGSKDAPLTIQAGERQDVTLSVFAQNATKTSYTVKVTATVEDGKSVTMDLTFGCRAAAGSVSFTKGTVDSATLATTYTVTNIGTEKITDLTLSAAGEAADYVRISPSVENYEIVEGGTVEVKLIPDLGKMKANNKNVITGQLVASGGASAQADIFFDTNGQDITSMTMGQLALYQDGNPLYNLEMKEDSLSVKVTNGDQETDISSYVETKGPVNTAEKINDVLDVIIDETDATFNISYGSEYSYGENKSMSVNIQVSTKALSAAPLSLMQDKEYYTYNKDTGTLTYTETYYLSPEEYLGMLADSTHNVGSALSVQDWTGKAYELNNPDASAFEVKVMESIVDPDLWKSFGFEDVLPPIFDSDLVGELGQIGDCFSTAGDIVDTYTVWTNPTIDNTTKTYYTGLTITKNILRWGKSAVAASPLDGAGYIACLLGEFFVDCMLEDLETEMNSSALFYNIYGRQCTNASRVKSSFYIPDFGDNQVTIYETGRMYDGSPYGGNAGYAEDQFGGDHYIHNRDVRYDYILNGTKVGETKNNGLTEVSIAKLDGSALRPGTNTLVRDYNTNAGHYSVVADTEITILYPADTEISYIGKPEGLEDVRLLPDFAVYEENILPEAAIIGEATTVKVYVYNRGSRSGWTDISISDGATLLYSAENVKIDAFSDETVTFNWTPAAETTNLTVTLTNKSVGLAERKTDNNTATRAVKARSRQVPVIGSITPTEAVLEGSAVRFTVGISNIADVTSASFTVDGATQPSTLTALTADTAQAAVKVHGLAAGGHTVKASVMYKTGPDTEAAVEGAETTITIKAPSEIPFTIGADVIDSKFTIVRANDFRAVTVSNLTVATHTVICNADMTEHPENYYLVTVCQGGLILTPLNELNNKELSLTGGKDITIESGSEVQLGRVRLQKLNGKSFYLDVTPKDGVLTCVGVNSCQLSIGYSVAGMSLNANVSVADLTGSKTINLADYYQLYHINMPANQQYNENTYFYGSIYYKTALGTQRYYPSTNNGIVYDAAKNQLTVLVTSSSPAEDAELLLTVNGNTLYRLDLANGTDPITAEWNHYKVTYTCTQANTLSVSSTQLEVSENTTSLGGQLLYLPVGEYNFLVNYAADGKQCHHTSKFVIADQDVTEDLPGPAENPATATFTWPSTWSVDDAYLNYSVTDSSGKHWNAGIQVSIGEPVTLPAGEQNLNLTLYRHDGNTQIAYGTFELKVMLTEGANTNVAVADTYEGTANITNTSWYAGDYCNVEISDMKAQDGTELSYYYASHTKGYLNGTVTLTKQGNPSVEYTVPFTRSNLYNYTSTSISFLLPEDMEAGEYTYEVLLTTAQIASRQYTITFDANGGSGAMEAQTVDAGTEYTLPSCGFGAPSNSEFKAWKIYDVEYAQGAVYTVNQPTTVYAVWKDKTSGSDIGGNPDDSNPSYPPYYPYFPDYDNSYSSPSTPSYSVTPPSGTANGLITVNPKNASSGSTVTITAKPDDGYELDKLTVTDANGREVAVSNQGNGKYTFKMPASKVKIGASFKKISPTSNPFSDVAASDYFYDAVLWAVENEITNGISANTFAPNTVCNRAQMVTFLWRAAGSPEPVSYANPFSDVDLGAYYGKAVLWAIEQGITNGTSATAFDPTAVCNRAQMATFMFRFAKGRTTGTGTPFGDVEKGSYYEEAVQWAVENGITYGISTTTYGPAMDCTRGQIVSFLYRYFVG